MIEKAPRQSMLENLSSVIQPEPCPLSGAKKCFTVVCGLEGIGV
jgi:hypothetical protein